MTNREGWTKTAVDQMYKTDSFIKESQRLQPLGGGKFVCAKSRVKITAHMFSAVVVTRKTLKEFTFSNGVKVPPDVNIVISSIPHRDPEVFEDPSKFDGFRFVKMKERASLNGYPDKKFDMVSIGTHSLAFGHGRTACPGRFLAASELKMMFAYVVSTYDVKLADGVRPPDLYVIHNCIPNRTAEVLFKRRGV